jgi:adapter protein MecA 1/2
LSFFVDAQKTMQYAGTDISYKCLFTARGALAILRYKDKVGGLFVRIERLNDTQMRFIFMTDDLTARGINVSELHYNSDKTQQLFREIMERVHEEGDFCATQFMMEAKWDADGMVVVMVTKLAESTDEDDFDLCPAARTHGRFKRAPFLELPETSEEESHSIFSFADMELAAAAAAGMYFTGYSKLYKLEGRYYLWLLNETDDERTTPELERTLHEFGQKHVSSNLSQHYLEERGETIIADGAVEKLRRYHIV